jgi:Zn ribbon nucleic-acid-binding protein
MPAKKYPVKPYSERGYSSSTESVKCYCPKCEQTHTMQILWIGKGTPRKFCQRCKSRQGHDIPQNLNSHRMRKQITISL